MKIKLALKKSSNIQFHNSDVVELDLEDYISGCVAQEIGNAHIEACKAQAIAARTNCQPYIKNDKSASDQSSSFQAYEGSKANNLNYPNPRQAAQETKSIVLTYNGKIALPASFSANNGGKVTSSAERWGGTRAWLISKEDPYDVGKKTGHGVGMSQRGAKKMAELGFSYQEILEFYFPRTQLAYLTADGGIEPMATKASKVKEWALSKKGCGYVWGATGYVLTQSKLDSLIKQYPDYVSQSKNGKWLGKQVFDCAQFTRFAMKEVGITLVSGASSQWKKTDWEVKGTIDTLPKDKVCILYRESPSANPMQHTGVYLGDGYVMDARGSNSGVVYSKLSSYAWTHWAIPKGLYDGVEIEDEPEEVLPVLYQAKVVAKSGDTVRMRANASSSASVLKSIRLGEIVDVVAELDGWHKIVYNGQTGYMMNQFLEKVQTSAPAPDNKVWYVRVECGSEADAKAIAAALKLCGNAIAAQG